MGDYDLQIMVALVVASALFGSFMILYAQQPTKDYIDEELIFTNFNFNISTNETVVVEEDPTLMDWIFGVVGLADEKEALDEMTAAIGNVFRLVENFEKTEMWIVGIFTSSMSIIGLIIVARFLRGQ